MSQNLKGKREPAIRLGKSTPGGVNCQCQSLEVEQAWTIWGTQGSHCGSNAVDEGGKLRESGRGIVTQGVWTRVENQEAIGVLSADE